MRITIQDLNKWKANTLALARELSLDDNILAMLEGCKVEIIPGNSGRYFYGFSDYGPPKVRVFERNPSKYFPRALWEVWNQSGMDHELIGHIYSYYSGFRHDEFAARQIQVGIARRRGRNNFLWRLASLAEPTLRTVQKYRNYLVYKK
ncbi:hypothetical protein HYX07_05110 [Candidatus Woesearchaeota archaeon]|nr:hypothetical protein [Candidatus Woesearchaeota archaeon]